MQKQIKTAWRLDSVLSWHLDICVYLNCNKCKSFTKGPIWTLSEIWALSYWLC